MVTKQQAAEIVREAQFRTGTSWQKIAEAIGRPVVWTVAALLGQHPMSLEEATKAGEMLGLDEDVVSRCSGSHTVGPAARRSPPTRRSIASTRPSTSTARRSRS